MKCSTLCVLVVLVTLTVIFCWAGQAKAATISDNQFNSSDWSTLTLFANNDATHSGFQSASGGNPGAFWRMIHTLPGGHPSTHTFIWIFHQYLGGFYDPSTDGAVAFLDYSEDRIQFDPPFVGAQIGAYPALVQDGVVFFGLGMTFPNTTWQTASLTDLTAADFKDFDSMTFHGGDGIFDNPDFSSSGGAIHFGYIRANSTIPGSASITTQHGIDNWSVAITPVPVPATVWLFGPALLGFVGCRRFRS